MNDQPFLIARSLGDKGMQARYFNLRLDGPARHVRIGDEDRGARLESYVLAAALGFAAGLFLTVGLAWIWSFYL